MLTIFSQLGKIKEILDAASDKSILDYRIFVRLNIELDIYIKVNIESDILGKLKPETDKYKTNVLIYSSEEIENDPFLDHIFRNNETKIDYGLKYRFHTLLDSVSFEKEKDLPPIATFYSYKGGMGRTTTLTSYALHLAQVKGRRVVVIDFDLEAPGYLNFFNLSQNQELLGGTKNGIVEYLIDAKFSKEKLHLPNYYIELGKREGKESNGDAEIEISNYVGQGAVFIFPAGNLTTEDNSQQYLQALSRLDFANEGETVSAIKDLFFRIRSDDNIKPDIILIDSRTGFNDVYGIVALTLSDAIVGFFGSSEQTKPGLEFLLNNVEKSHKELLLINSILPEQQKEKYHKNFSDILREIGEEEYSFLPLTRVADLEGIGVYSDDERKTFIEDKLVSLIVEKKIPDLENVFSTLNRFRCIQRIFPKIKESTVDLLKLRNTILTNLRKDIPSTYAEESGKVDISKFFYREAMTDIFKKSNFVVQGFKGTGKTYLYKALKEKGLYEIQNELKKRAIKKGIIGDKDNFVFIDIISEKGKDDRKLFDFSSLKLSDIKDPDYFYKYFWVVYTWNSILLDAKEKLGFYYTSPLQDKITEIKPDLHTALRFTEIIDSQVDLITIEKDLNELNAFLESKNTNLVILYDQLDNLVKPENWGAVVSPLVDFWWNNNTRYSRFFPKIFIRTDLFNRLKGTNIERLKDKNNLIPIEWSRDEVYAYFLKLVFSNPSSKNAFILYLKQQKNISINFSDIDAALNENQNQLPIKPSSRQNIHYNRELLEPFMTAFFGEEVIAKTSLGKPYDWFYQNLCNADGETISLRPFINLIAGSLEYASKREYAFPIIHYTYYANLKNRERAVEAHFRDLVREDYNKDLIKIFERLRESGEKYKYIFLTKPELQQFLNEVLMTYKKSLECPTIDDLKNLLYSNGILHENPSPYGQLYYFPQLYKYWLGLKSRKPNDVRKDKK